MPESHWTADTHRFNIASYDGASAASYSQSSSSSSPPETGAATEIETDADPEKARLAADKAFKKELYHYLRWALSAGNPGPGIPETMAILGRAESVRRLDEARRLTASSSSDNNAGGTGSTSGLLFPGRPKSQNQKEGDLSWMGSLAPR